MLDISSAERVEARPLSIHRRGPASEATNLLLDLEPGEAFMFKSPGDKEHKAAQRSINVLMKNIKKSRPELTFVTRTVSINEDEVILGVYRVEDRTEEEIETEAVKKTRAIKAKAKAA